MDENVCQKCGYVWTPRTKEPVACPACKSYKWNEKPTVEVKKGGK